MNSSPSEPALRTRWYAQLAFGIAAFLGMRPSRDLDYRSFDESPLAPEAPNTLADELVVRLAAQDWLFIGYLLTLLARVAVSERGPHGLAMGYLGLDLTLFLGILWLTRGGVIASPKLSGLVYRLGALLPLLSSFFQLQYILPAASGPAVDADVYAFDVRVFGFEPSMAWDRFVTPRTTEWFSFFYYGYFYLVAIHVLPLLLFGRDSARMRRFSFGFVWLYCVGHVVYTFVPAYGPHAFLSARFGHVLQGGMWWPLVQQTVASVDGSVRTDVFPSLHTAGPTFLALFAFEYRRSGVFRWTWLPTALAATQIILATMFLRWHYAVDIVAGILLAVSGIYVSRAALWWDSARERAGGPQVWPPTPFR